MYKSDLTLAMLMVILTVSASAGDAVADEQGAQSPISAVRYAAPHTRMPLFQAERIVGLYLGALTNSANSGAHVWGHGSNRAETRRTADIMETTRAVATAMAFISDFAGRVGHAMPLDCRAITGAETPGAGQRGVSAGISVLFEGHRSPRLALDLGVSRTCMRCLARDHQGH